MGTMTTNVVSTCTSKNAGNNCAIRACIMERTFVNDFTNLYNKLGPRGIYQYNPKFSKFNFDETCSVTPKGKVEKSCCGEYPNRFPYGIENGRRCCGGKTYNSGVKECCDSNDSDIRDIG